VTDSSLSSAFYQGIQKKLLIIPDHSVTVQMFKCDGAMSQQSADIKAPYMEQKRYFLGLSFTVRQKSQQMRKKYFSNNLM